MLLRNKDKQTLLQIFSSLHMPFEVWAYGSRVNGTAHDGSDLDLVIRSQNLQKISMDTLMELKEKIRDSNIPIVVELFDWARLPGPFHSNIQAKHEVLFSNSEKTVNDPSPSYNLNHGDLPKDHDKKKTNE